MATFQDILDEVTWKTSRPDLAARIEFACLQALHDCHSLGYFVRDLRYLTFDYMLTEELMVWDDPATMLSARIILQAGESFPVLADGLKLRKVRDFAVFSDAAMRCQTQGDFKNLATDPIYDDFKRKCRSTYLHIGREIQVNFSAAPAYGRFWYFTVPITAAAADTSEIVERFPEAVINRAISRIASTIGESSMKTEADGQMAMFNDLIVTNLETL